MAGLSDTPEGGETRRYGNTVGVPHGESDGTALADASVQPGDAVTIDSGVLAKAGTGDAILGVLVNYDVYGASHRGELISGDVDATVAVQGTYKARADSDLSAGDSAGLGDTDGHFGNVDDQGFRVVETYNDGSQDWVEVVL
jgi:hypothetical protein